MPTIDELPPANSVSDTDELVLSQTDIARKATRAQLLSGVQPALALPQNSLLGRVSAGTGAPETISIGANLAVNNFTISAPAPFVISSLPAAGALQSSDLVAVAQVGQNAAANYGAFMGGLADLTGISGSNLLVTPTGGVGARRVADIFGDALSIESFGAIGDGVTDNTSAFSAAAQAGAPIRLGSLVYILNGPLLVAAPSAWSGVTGETIVRRAQVINEQPWIEIAGASLFAAGIIFDGNNLADGVGTSVQIDATCLTATITNCQFVNALGAGDGLHITCGNTSAHKITACQFCNNGVNGITVSGTGTVTLRDCLAIGNTSAGISVSAGTACWLQANTCSQNSIGIAIGNWQAAANGSGALPSCLVAGNLCCGNVLWGLAVGANAALIKDNVAVSNGQFGSGGGMVLRLGSSQIDGNQVSGGAVGIDARTTESSSLTENLITGTTNGMLLGGCQNVIASRNFFALNQWGISVSAIEPALSFVLTGPVSISANWIRFTLAQGGGVSVLDGCLGLRIVDNDFNGSGSATINQALWLESDQAIVAGNSWNNQPIYSTQSYFIGGLSALVVPDIIDNVLITAATNPVQSLMTCHQADTLGQVSFIRVTDGGSGYSSAEIAIDGGGRGATATAVINQGQIIWIVLTNAGSGYGLIGSDAPVTITGDGNGADATAYVGIPVLTGRRLRLSCNCTVQLTPWGSSPPQQNWTDYSITVPALGAVEIEGVFGAWRAVDFPATDYLYPSGDGGAVLQSTNGGNVTLRPGAGGSLQIASYSEPAGCTSSVGRGSPTGSVEAPPGSDFRNLNGGAGNTLWIKQTGTDANGWIAVA